MNTGESSCIWLWYHLPWLKTTLHKTRVLSSSSWQTWEWGSYSPEPRQGRDPTVRTRHSWTPVANTGFLLLKAWKEREQFDPQKLTLKCLWICEVFIFDIFRKWVRLERLPLCIEMLLDVQISNEISNDKWCVYRAVWTGFSWFIEQHRIFISALEVTNALTFIL